MSARGAARQLGVTHRTFMKWVAESEVGDKSKVSNQQSYCAFDKVLIYLFCLYVEKVCSNQGFDNWLLTCTFVRHKE